MSKLLQNYYVISFLINKIVCLRTLLPLEISFGSTRNHRGLVMVSVVSLVLWYFVIVALDFRFLLCLVHSYATLLWSCIAFGFHGLLVVVFILSFYVLSLGNWFGKEET